MFKYKRTVLALAVTAFATLAVTACEPVDGTAVPGTQADKAPGLWISTTTPKPYVAPTTKLPAKADPYSSNGMWRVPEDIAAGEYRVIPTSDFGGYWKLCATMQCKIGTSGFIENDLISGPSYISIPAEARFIELSRVRLESAS